jgi:hypothetical protein
LFVAAVDARVLWQPFFDGGYTVHTRWESE